jgi:hypothetical protein
MNQNILLKFFRIRKTNQLVVYSNKLANNFADIVTSGLGPDVACGLLVDHAVQVCRKFAQYTL